MVIPFKIDLASNRVVYPNDIKVGVREIELTKGINYTGQVTFISGSFPFTGNVENFSCTISERNKKDTPFIQATGLNDGCFKLNVASPTLDYAINGKDTLRGETDISFSVGGTVYNLESLNTVINNAPGLTPAEEYYPLNSNPYGYVTQTDLTAALNGESGLFYPASNPSGFVPADVLNGVVATLTSGIAALSNATGSYVTNSALNPIVSSLQSGLAALNSVTGKFITSDDLPFIIEGDNIVF